MRSSSCFSLMSSGVISSSSPRLIGGRADHRGQKGRGGSPFFSRYSATARSKAANFSFSRWYSWANFSLSNGPFFWSSWITLVCLSHSFQRRTASGPHSRSVSSFIASAFWPIIWRDEHKRKGPADSLAPPSLRYRVTTISQRARERSSWLRLAASSVHLRRTAANLDVAVLHCPFP